MTYSTPLASSVGMQLSTMTWIASSYGEIDGASVPTAGKFLDTVMTFDCS